MAMVRFKLPSDGLLSFRSVKTVKDISRRFSLIAMKGLMSKQSLIHFAGESGKGNMIFIKKASRQRKTLKVTVVWVLCVGVHQLMETEKWCRNVWIGSITVCMRDS